MNEYINNNEKGLYIDPRTKLFLLLVMNIVLLSFGNSKGLFYLRFAVGFLPFIMILTDKRIKMAIIYLIIYVGSHLTIIYLIDYTAGPLVIILGFITSIATRFMPGGMLGFYFLISTKVNEVVAAMERMHISQKIIIPISVMFRFFPTVKEEAEGISDAMRMRKLGFGYFFKRPVEILEYRMVPMMISVVNIGEDLSASALTRCLGMKKSRTNISRCGFGWIDGILFVIGAVFAVLYFLIAGGVLYVK